MQDGSVSPVRNFFRNKWVLLVLAFNILAIVIVVVLYSIDSSKNAGISFSITPLDAEIKVDGKGGYNNSGEAYYVTPGTHEIQISYGDLTPKIFTIDLLSNHSITITTFLSRDGDFYFYTLKNNIGSFNMLAEIASAGDNQTTDQDTSAEAFIADFQRNYNLYQNDLPVTYSEYDYDEYGRRVLSKYLTVRQSYSCDITLCLEAVIEKEDEKDQIELLLRDAGFNLEDFEIGYRIY